MSGATTGDELYQRHTMLVFSASACLFSRENGGLCGRFVLDDEMTGKAVSFGSPIRRAPDWYESRWRFDTDDAATGWLDASVGADGTEVSYTRRNGGGVAARRSIALSGERFSLGSFVMHSARKPKSSLQRYMLLRKGKDILA